MSTGKGGGGGGKGGSFAPTQSYSPFTPVASGNGTGYYNPQQQLAPPAYNPMMDAYGSRQNVMQPMSGYYNQYQLPASNYQPYQPPAPQPAPQPYQPFQPFQPPVPQPQQNNNFFSNNSIFDQIGNQGGNNTFGVSYGNSYAHFTPDYNGQQNFYEPRPNYFGRPSQNPFQSQAPAAPAPAAAPTPAPAQNYNYSTEPDEVYQEPIFNIRATDPGMPVEPSYNRYAEGNQAPILNQSIAAEPTVQQRYQQTIAARQQPQYVAPEPRIYGHQRTAQMPILDSADQVSAPAANPGFDGYDANMYTPTMFGGIYL